MQLSRLRTLLGKVHYLPQIRTHQQHPVIFVTHLDNALAYGLGCANVDSTGRLIAHNKLCMAGKLPGNDHFLDITARKHAHQLRAVGTEYIKIFYPLVRIHGDSFIIQGEFLLYCGRDILSAIRFSRIDISFAAPIAIRSSGTCTIPSSLSWRMLMLRISRPFTVISPEPP